MKLTCSHCENTFEVSEVSFIYYCCYCGTEIHPFAKGVSVDYQVKAGLEFVKDKQVSVMEKINMLRNNGYFGAASWLDKNKKLYSYVLIYGLKDA